MFAGFGAAPAPAPAPAVGFAFGAAPAPAPAPAAGGFSFAGFGAAPAPAAPAPAPAPAPAFGGFGGFGAPAPAPSPAPAFGGFFGAPAAPAAAAAAETPEQLLQKQALEEYRAHLTALFEKSKPVRELVQNPSFRAALPPELLALASAYRTLPDSGDTRVVPSPYPFRALTYNVRDDSRAYVRHPLMTEEEWRREVTEHEVDEGADPPVRVIPTMLVGFEALRDRLALQNKQVAELKNNAVALRTAVQGVQRQNEELSTKLELLLEREAEIARRALALAGRLEPVILEARARPEARELQAAKRLRAVLHQLEKMSQWRSRLEQLLLVQRLREEASAAGASQGGRRAGSLTGEGDVAALAQQLEVQRSHIESLVDVVRRAGRDLEVMGDDLSRPAPAR